MSKSSTQYHELPDYPTLLNRLYELRPIVEREYWSLVDAIPNCRRDDARTTAIGHLIQLIDSTVLIFTFIDRNLLPLNNDWWKAEVRLPMNSERDKSVMINNLTVGFAKLGFIQNLFGIIDSSFRLFLRTLKDAEPPLNFTVVSKQLKSELAAFPSGAKNLLDLLAHTRNTVHNNGVYFFFGDDYSVEYKGTVYEFKHGEPIRFVTWEWLIENIPEVLAILVPIIRDKRLLSIDYVRDPFSSRASNHEKDLDAT